jgi:alpha-N-acetylglucosamine transferase
MRIKRSSLLRRNVTSQLFKYGILFIMIIMAFAVWLLVPILHWSSTFQGNPAMSKEQILNDFRLINESSSRKAAFLKKFYAPRQITSTSSDDDVITTTTTTTTKTTTESIAFVITVTECVWSVRDAAAIHGYAIDTIQRKSKYPHQRYAIILNQTKTTALHCARDLQNLGYQVLIRDMPFQISDIQFKVFQSKILDDAGYEEYLKLWIYTLDQHKVAIHLDMDTLLLQPLDDLWDAMLDPANNQQLQTEASSVYQPNTEQQINFMFTRDYLQGSKLKIPNVMNRHNITTRWGIQGGFYVVRPSQSTFQDLVDLVVEGFYQYTKGWHRDGYGGYWGSAQMQGLLSYYYRPTNPKVTKGSAVELNRCIYNNRHDPLYFSSGQYNGNCTTLEDTCTNDCRTTPFPSIKLVHMATACTKPWNCERMKEYDDRCAMILQKWYKTRKKFERHYKIINTTSPKPMWFHHYSLGYCRKEERKNENIALNRGNGKSMYKTYQGFYRRIILPWDPIARIHT